MPRHSPRQHSDRFVAAVLLALFVLMTSVFPASSDGGQRSLQLEVTINGSKTDLIVPFTQVPGRGLFTERKELEELFIRPPGSGRLDDTVRLEDLGIGYVIDEARQSIDLKVGDGLRLRRSYDAHRAAERPQAGRADYGAVINYSLYAAAEQHTNGWREFNTPAFSGANVGLDTRLVTPHGVIANGFLLGANVVGATEVLRLDSYAMRVAPETMMTYRIGDAVTGGLAWTRPFRFGGVQMQHNYAYRPDIVTGALPSYSGSAAVPSTVDVYVNNVKTFSQDVAAGPFQLQNLPLQSTNGEARVVVRDASGRTQETTLPFTSSGRLLREGVYESSVELGMPRLRYGILSDDYEEKLVAAATLRRGLTDALTLETHAEAGLGVVNGGVGVVGRANRLGVFNFAVAGSGNGDRSGLQGYAAFETRVGAVSLRASTLRSTRAYDDIARVTAKLRPSLFNVGTTGVGFLGPRFDVKPSRAVDNLSVSLPLGFDPTTLTASFLRVESDEGDVSRLVLASLSRPLIAGANFFATGFFDLDDRRNRGVFAGVHIPLGKTPLGIGSSASLGVTHTSQGTTATADVSKMLGGDVGSWGWRVRDAEGDQAYREAGVSHRAKYARLEAGVRQDADVLGGRFSAEGAVVAMGGNVFLANRIDDGFAVVDTGAPGVIVKHQNHVVGETNGDGKILVPNLRAYHENRIAIDPRNLPVDAQVDRTSLMATPAFRSGVYVDFKVKTSVAAALVTLHDTAGKPIPTGSEVTLNGGAASKAVGYDGQVYIDDLVAKNTLTVMRPDKTTCVATFAYAQQPGTQTIIGPVPCQ